MSFATGDPTFEEHVMLPQFFQEQHRESRRMPHQGVGAPSNWTIWPHMDYDDLSKLMPKGLHRFHKLAEAQKNGISPKGVIQPESAAGYMIRRALEKEANKRERELKLELENERIRTLVVAESERRWKALKTRELHHQESQWTMWWESWRERTAEEARKRVEPKWQLDDQKAVNRMEYEKLRAMEQAGLGNSLARNKKALVELGLTAEQYKALVKKIEFDEENLEERRLAKYQEYEEILEIEKIKTNFGWSVFYIYHDEKTLWKKPIIYTAPEPAAKTPRQYVNPAWSCIKKKLPMTSPIMNEWGDISWRFAHGSNFRDKYHEMKYRNVFLKWVNSHLTLKEEPVPRELLVMSQMVYCVKRTKRRNFQKMVTLFGSRGYFEKPVYNRRLESLTAEDLKENVYSPVNAGPFIELSNYFGGMPNVRKTVWYFNWHFHKQKNIYRWTFDNLAFRLYRSILYPGRPEFVCKGEHVVEYLHDNWDGYQRPNYNFSQRVVIFKNYNEDYPLSFYHKIMDRAAASKTWVIGFPYWEAGRYPYEFIFQSYLFRHAITGVGFYALFLGFYHPSSYLLCVAVSSFQVFMSFFYRLYFDSNPLIEYANYPHVFHYFYSPVQDDPQGVYTQFFEYQPAGKKKIVERGFYKIVTSAIMLQMVFRQYLSRDIMVTVPCRMVPYATFPSLRGGLLRMEIPGTGWAFLAGVMTAGLVSGIVAYKLESLY